MHKFQIGDKNLTMHFSPIWNVHSSYQCRNSDSYMILALILLLLATLSPRYSKNETAFPFQNVGASDTIANRHADVNAFGKAIPVVVKTRSRAALEQKKLTEFQMVDITAKNKRINRKVDPFNSTAVRSQPTGAISEGKKTHGQYQQGGLNSPGGLGFRGGSPLSPGQGTLKRTSSEIMMIRNSNHVLK
jgi:hypothetical protein